MPFIWETIVGLIAVLILCIAMTLIIYFKRMLTFTGSVSAFGVGMVIGVLGDIVWLILLLVFLLSSFAATKYKFATKEAWGVQEGLKGERGGRNVLAHGLVPALIAVIAFLSRDLHLPLLPTEVTGLIFISAISIAASDTLASEIGVLSDNTYLITTWEKVRPGTNGGVSWFGQMWAFFGATYTSVIGWLILHPFSDTLSAGIWIVWIPILVGFLGCQIDSVLGATLEERGHLNKDTNNLVTIAIGVIISILLYTFLA
ncbi:MAG: TIGR00297 family protein [Thermoplasmata archaeon]